MTLRRISKSKALSVVVALVLVGAVLGALVSLNTRSEPQATASSEQQAPLSHEPQVTPSQEPEVALTDEPQTTPPEEATPASSEEPLASPAAEPKTITTTKTGVLPPDEPGPYKVGRYWVSYEVEPYGTYYATIRYPAESNGNRKPKDTSGAPYPGIVVSNGYYGSEWNIVWIPNHLASHGYVTICFTPPEGGTLNTWTISGLMQSTDITQWAEGFNGGIEKLKDENERLDSPIYGLADINTIGVIGLSMGGGGVLEVAGTNPEVDAVVALAPAYIGLDNVDGVCDVLAQTDVPVVDLLPESLCKMLDWMGILGFVELVFSDVYQATENITVPTQLQVGTNDGFTQPIWVHAAYEDMPNTTPREYVEITGGSHAAFIDLWVAPIGNFIEWVLGGGNVCGFKEQHKVASRYFTAWFNYFLKGLDEYGTYIFGDEAQQDVDEEVLSAFEHNLT